VRGDETNVCFFNGAKESMENRYEGSPEERV